MQRQGKRDFAKARDFEFDKVLSIDREQAQAMRIGYTQAVKAKKLRFCSDFNRKGVPCAGIECVAYGGVPGDVTGLYFTVSR